MNAESGGYLQWDEVDIGAYCTESPNAAVADTGSRRLVQYIVEYFQEFGSQFGLVDTLPFYYHHILHFFDDSTLPLLNNILQLDQEHVQCLLKG